MADFDFSKFSNKRVDDEAKRNEFLNKSASSTINGNSPFLDGMVLTNLAYEVMQSAQDGVVADDAPIKLVLTTNGPEIPITMLVRPKIDFNGNHVVPDGTFTKKLKEILSANPNYTVSQLGAALTAAAPNGLRVRRTPYAGRSKDGRQYPASLVNFDIV